MLVKWNFWLLAKVSYIWRLKRCSIASMAKCSATCSLLQHKCALNMNELAASYVISWGRYRFELVVGCHPWHRNMYLLKIGFLWPHCVADADIIFLPCGFYLSIFFYSSLNLSGRRLDVYRTDTWCGLSANLECMSEMCCTRLARNTGCKKSPSAHHRTTLSGYIFLTKARIDNRKKTR